MENEKKLFLLDGFALIYRAYFAFAKNPRINSKGLETSAVLGLTNTLNELIRKEQPSHIAMVFDRSAPTERHIEYPEYKAHRDAMPDGIKDALPYIDKLLEAFNIPKIYKDGFEADDIIGTLAKKAEEKGFITYMMTSDKDFAQLVSKKIFMYRPGNKWQPNTIWGVDEVLKKFKINRVDQVIDFLAMMGDAADNIPGIAGVGEKTAQKFLNQYDTMEGLFANSHKLKGKIKESVEASEEIGLLCKKLTTIITDVPISFNEESLKYKAINKEKIISLFEELEFKTLLQRMIGYEPSTATKKEIPTEGTLISSDQFDLFDQPKLKHAINTSDNNFKYIEDLQKIESIVANIKKKREFSFQLITDSDNALTTKIIGVSLSYMSESGYYFKYNDRNKHFIKELFEDPKNKIIGFNLKFAIKLLFTHDINIKGKLFDVQIAHYLLHPDMRNSLDIISENYLGVILKDKITFLGRGKNKINFSQLSASLLADYAAERSLAIFDISKLLEVEMTQSRVIGLFEKIEIPLLRVLAKMEIEGIALDKDMLKNYSVELTKEIELITTTIYNLAGEKFNISSPKQMGELLFEKMSLSKKPKKTKSGQYATSEEALLKIKDTHPIIKEVLRFRGIKKLLSTYVDALPDLVNSNTNRIHTTFNQSVASTGRLSSTNPNIQNIPIRTKIGKKVRESFVPKNQDYALMSADYSQIELRIMASLSNDKAMISGKDFIIAHES